EGCLRSPCGPAAREGLIKPRPVRLTHPVQELALTGMGEPAAQLIRHRRLTQAEVDAICVRHDRLWSSRTGGARAVFTWKDLSGLDLSGRNLCDADFTGAILAECKLAHARLDNANLFGADLQNANLAEASLRRADLRGACLRGANLTGADLFEADLREGTIAA